MQRAYPAMAIEIQDALGVGGYGFDMNVACSSATFAHRAGGQRGATRHGARGAGGQPGDHLGHLDWRDRDCHFIFGDVCTAVLVERADDGARRRRWEVLGTQAGDQFSNNIRNNFGFLNRCEDADPDDRDKLFVPGRPQGVQGSLPAGRRAHRARTWRALGLSPTGVRRFWLHQANLAMNQLIAQAPARPRSERRRSAGDPRRVRQHRSAGSIIAFHHHRGDLTAGDVGVICSFGAGYSIGSVVVRRG